MLIYELVQKLQHKKQIFPFSTFLEGMKNYPLEVLAKLCSLLEMCNLTYISWYIHLKRTGGRGVMLRGSIMAKTDGA